MQRHIHCFLLSALFSTPLVHAGEIVRVAAGDCAGLAAAAGAAPGQEPALIVLARNASYNACAVSVRGTISIDGAGARMPLVESRSDSSGHYQIAVASSAQLTIRNMNFGTAP